MASKPKVLILTGYGLSGEQESSFAWEQAGAEPKCVLLGDLLKHPELLHKFHIFMFIGGFPFGGHLGSGHVLALMLRSRLMGDFSRFIQAGGLILGVAGGCQTMVKLGLLPGFDGNYSTQRVAFVPNDCGVFQNLWVNLRFEANSPCVFTRGLDYMPLPFRNGDAKLFVPDRELMRRLEKTGCVVCRYADAATGNVASEFPANPAGSPGAIAGLCDPTGRVCGLMAHPESYLFPENHPQWDFQAIDGVLPPRGLGLRIFENAVAVLR